MYKLQPLAAWPVKRWNLTELWDEAKKVEANLVRVTNYDEALKRDATLILSTELGFTSIYKRDVNE